MDLVRCFRFHDQYGVAPGVEQSPHEDPEDPIAVFDLGALHAAPEYHYLLTESDVLESKSRSISEQRVDDGQQQVDPVHPHILTRERNRSKLGPVLPL